MKRPNERFFAAALLLVFVFMIFTLFVFSSSASDGNISLSARSAALYEPTTGEFIYKKNSSISLPMASTTKIMTALVAIENASMNTEFTIPKEACGIEGSSLYLREGEILTISDLLYGLMLRSANDAAVALAYAISDGIEGFAQMMNERAADMGLKSTHFVNPHGLDNEYHYTTAEELAIITAEAMKNDAFKEIVSTQKIQITAKDGTSRLIVNHNKLLRLYDGAVGVKTGFTKKSGRCLVGAAERNGLSFISVTIDAPDDWNDHSKLFDYGFSRLKAFSIEADQFSYKLPLIGAENKYLHVSNKDSFKLILDANETMPDFHIKLNKYVAAPVKKGDVIGKIVFTQNDKMLGSVDIVSLEDAEASKSKGFFNR